MKKVVNGVEFSFQNPKSKPKLEEIGMSNIDRRIKYYVKMNVVYRILERQDSKGIFRIKI